MGDDCMRKTELTQGKIADQVETAGIRRLASGGFMTGAKIKGRLCSASHTLGRAGAYTRKHEHDEIGE